MSIARTKFLMFAQAWRDLMDKIGQQIPVVGPHCAFINGQWITFQ
jgi:hypothetical protein